jgi:hypothetical protein
MTCAPIHFLIFCIETYKIIHCMPGEEVFGLLTGMGLPISLSGFTMYSILGKDC